MVNAGYLLLFIVAKILFLSCQCLQHTPELRLKNGCYMNTTGLNSENFNHFMSCPRDRDPIEMNFKPGNVKGSVIAEFLLAHPLCYQSAYKIELLHAEGRNENKTCSGTSSPESHSDRKFSVIECGNCTDTCGKYGNVQFFNVVPGCYKANVLQFSSSNIFKYRVTNWTYIGDPGSETWDVKVDIKVIVLPSQGMNFSVKFSKPTSYVIIKFKLMNTKKTKAMDLSKLLENEGCHFMKTETDKRNITKYDGLSCSFPALSENYSYIQVNVFKDEQCDNEMKYEERSYQNHPACWTKQTQALAVTKNNNVLMERSNNWILFGIIASSFFVVLISCCIIFKQLHKRRKPKTPPSIEESAPLIQDTMSDDYEILLLYAKDCKEFMVTMESFRHMLGNLCNVKVYDCYDEPNWEDEQISPHTWLEKIMISKPSLRIILVSTLSACIQRQGYLSGAMNGKASAFKNPSYLDKVFLYGLEIIKEDEIPNHHPYEKIFIIQLNGFSDDTNSKEISSLLRVYQIPLHLELLIRDMKKASSKKYIHKDDGFKIKHPRIEINQEDNSYELSNITRSENYNKFLHHLERLRNFKVNNQNYLTDLLQPIIMNHNTKGENM